MCDNELATGKKYVFKNLRYHVNDFEKYINSTKNYHSEIEEELNTEQQ